MGGGGGQARAFGGAVRAAALLMGFILAALCSGCFGMFFFISVPTDEVKLVRVDQIEKFDEIAGRDNAGLRHWFKRRSSDQLLRITVSSQSDIASVAKRHEFNIFYRATLCPYDKGAVIEDGGSIYEAYEIGRVAEASANVTMARYLEINALVDLYRSQSASAASAAKEGQYRYEVFFFARRYNPHYKPEPGVFDDQPYDLIAAPQDVCLRIGGGNMLGVTLDSNVLVIPHQAIEAALRRGPGDRSAAEWPTPLPRRFSLDTAAAQAALRAQR